MADNVTIGSGDSVAADDIAGAKYQRVKLVHGADGVNAGDVAMANGFPVQPATGTTFPITDNGGSITVDGTVAVSGSVAVTGAFYQATQPVSIAASVAVTGPLTDAELRASAVPVSLASVPSHAVTNAGTFAVQASQSGTWNVTNISGTVSLPTGAATEAKQPALGTAGTASSDVITVQGVTGMTAVKVDGSAVTQPVSGTFWQATQPVSLASVPSHAVTNAGTFAVQVSSALPAGTNNIGDVDVLTVPADPFGANADAASATGSISAKLRFIASTGIPITGTVTVGSHAVTNAGTFAVQAAQSGTWTVNDAPVTSGGLSVSSFLSTATAQATQVKGSAGMVYAIEFFNVSATPVYVRLYNQTGAPANTDTANILWRGVVPGNTAGAGFVKTWDKGLAFSTGIGMRCTAAVADNDTTALSANTVIGNVDYK